MHRLNALVLTLLHCFSNPGFGSPVPSFEIWPREHVSCDPNGMNCQIVYTCDNYPQIVAGSDPNTPTVPPPAPPIALPGNTAVAAHPESASAAAAAAAANANAGASPSSSPTASSVPAAQVTTIIIPEMNDLFALNNSMSLQYPNGTNLLEFTSVNSSTQTDGSSKSMLVPANSTLAYKDLAFVSPNTTAQNHTTTPAGSSPIAYLIGETRRHLPRFLRILPFKKLPQARQSYQGLQRRTRTPSTTPHPLRRQLPPQTASRWCGPNSSTYILLTPNPSSPKPTPSILALLRTAQVAISAQAASSGNNSLVTATPGDGGVIYDIELVRTGDRLRAYDNKGGGGMTWGELGGGVELVVEWMGRYGGVWVEAQVMVGGGGVGSLVIT